MDGSYARTGRVSLPMSCAMLLVAAIGFAQQTPPDNTRVNARDRAHSQPTADQQQNGRQNVFHHRDLRESRMSRNSNTSSDGAGGASGAAGGATSLFNWRSSRNSRKATIRKLMMALMNRP